MLTSQFVEDERNTHRSPSVIRCVKGYVGTWGNKKGKQLWTLPHAAAQTSGDCVKGTTESRPLLTVAVLAERTHLFFGTSNIYSPRRYLSWFITFIVLKQKVVISTLPQNKGSGNALILSISPLILFPVSHDIVFRIWGLYCCYFLLQFYLIFLI